MTDLLVAQPDDLVPVTTWMPARIVLDFQRDASANVRRLVAAHPSTSVEIDLAAWDSSAFQPPYNANYLGDQDPWEVFEPLADSGEGRRIACWIADNFTDGGRQIAAGLLSNPGGMNTFDIADQAGYSVDGISSAFRAMVGRFRSCATRPFWNGNLESRGGPRGQLMQVPIDADAYRVFTQVFAARYPELGVA